MILAIHTRLYGITSVPNYDIFIISMRQENANKFGKITRKIFTNFRDNQSTIQIIQIYYQFSSLTLACFR